MKSNSYFPKLKAGWRKFEIGRGGLGKFSRKEASLGKLLYCRQNGSPFSKTQIRERF